MSKNEWTAAAKHSQTPWELRTNGGRPMVRIVAPARGDGFKSDAFRVADVHFSTMGLANTCRVEEAEANATRIVSCVNACAGIADPERDVPAMREALRELVWMIGARGPATADDLAKHESWAAARAVLARVEGGAK